MSFIIWLISIDDRNGDRKFECRRKWKCWLWNVESSWWKLSKFIIYQTEIVCSCFECIDECMIFQCSCLQIIIHSWAYLMEGFICNYFACVVVLETNFKCLSSISEYSCLSLFHYFSSILKNIIICAECQTSATDHKSLTTRAFIITLSLGICKIWTAILFRAFLCF